MSNLDPGAALERIRDSAPAGLAPADYLSLARALGPSMDGLEPLRLVVLSTYTTELFAPYLVVEAARHGFALDLFHGGFGQLEQTLLGDDWRAEEGVVEALVLAVRLEDLDPDVALRYHADRKRTIEDLGADALSRIEATLTLFRDRSNGPALVANFSTPRPRPMDVFEANDPGSLTYRVQQLNRALLDRLSARTDTYVWDYAGLVDSCGAEEWTDPRLWGLARTPVAARNQPHFAAHLARSLRGVVRPAAKCLVVDLDHTLWGGAIGDDGVGGIQLGDDHPGSAYKRFQSAILGLRDRGVLLAISSKNDEDVVRDALERHPDMLVRPEHFASIRINWLPKSENLRAIAAELNIGLDSLVFFDDNPVERAEVSDRAPEVRVVPVPSDPVLFVQALSRIPDFDVPALTSEDRTRARSYQEQRERSQALESSGSLESFLESLEMTVEIGALDDATVQRVTQLVAKTNQFNLTTRRHSRADLEAMQRAGAEIHWLRLRDRYGDMGLIAVGILVPEGGRALIESLILSCRAANRGIEQTLVAHLASRARASGVGQLVAEYVPTERNHVVAELYPGLGFELAEAVGEASRYCLDLRTESVEPPPYVRVTHAGA